MLRAHTASLDQLIEMPLPPRPDNPPYIGGVETRVSAKARYRSLWGGWSYRLPSSAVNALTPRSCVPSSEFLGIRRMVGIEECVAVS